MTQEETKQAHAIISYFQTKYKQKLNKKPIVNRNKVQYLIVNMLKDMTVAEVKKLIDFYVKTDVNPNLSYFCYEYDEVLVKMNDEASDLETRKALLDETRKSVEEFRRLYGNAG